MPGKPSTRGTHTAALSLLVEGTHGEERAHAEDGNYNCLHGEKNEVALPMMPNFWQRSRSDKPERRPRGFRDHSEAKIAQRESFHTVKI